MIFSAFRIIKAVDTAHDVVKAVTESQKKVNFLDFLARYLKKLSDSQKKLSELDQNIQTRMQAQSKFFAKLMWAIKMAKKAYKVAKKVHTVVKTVKDLHAAVTAAEQEKLNQQKLSQIFDAAKSIDKNDAEKDNELAMSDKLKNLMQELQTYQ